MAGKSPWPKGGLHGKIIQLNGGFSNVSWPDGMNGLIVLELRQNTGGYHIMSTYEKKLEDHGLDKMNNNDRIWYVQWDKESTNTGKNM